MDDLFGRILFFYRLKDSRLMVPREIRLRRGQWSNINRGHEQNL